MSVAAPMGIVVLLIIVAALMLIPIGIALVVVSLNRGKDNLGTNPNLAPCPDCNRLLSIRALTCPHCGRPMKG